MSWRARNVPPASPGVIVDLAWRISAVRATANARQEERRDGDSDCGLATRRALALAASRREGEGVKTRRPQQGAEPFHLRPQPLLATPIESAASHQTPPREWHAARLPKACPRSGERVATVCLSGSPLPKTSPHPRARPPSCGSRCQPACS